MEFTPLQLAAEKRWFELVGEYTRKHGHGPDEATLDRLRDQANKEVGNEPEEKQG